MTDEAFVKPPAGTVESLLKDPVALQQIVTYPAVAGKARAADIVKMESAPAVEGDSVKITVKDREVTLDPTMVLKTDIVCDNGVIHVPAQSSCPSKWDLSRLRFRSTWNLSFPGEIPGRRNTSRRPEFLSVRIGAEARRSLPGQSACQPAKAAKNEMGKRLPLNK
jgi:hypothetical protein